MVPDRLLRQLENPDLAFIPLGCLLKLLRVNTELGHPLNLEKRIKNAR